MRPEQNPKFKAVPIPDGEVFLTARIMNRVSKRIIPDDEPVFILRAQDRHAAATLLYYSGLVLDQEHADAVYDRVLDFGRFARKYPERMHEPDTKQLAKTKTNRHK